MSSSGERPPIFDVHLHADRLEFYGGAQSVCTNEHGVEFPGLDPQQPITVQKTSVCPDPLPSSATNELLIPETLALMERYNIFGVLAGAGDDTEVALWLPAAPERLRAAFDFTENDISAEQYRTMFEAGEFAVFAEVSPQYQGRSLADPEWDPYFALAEELDIPVGVHIGEGPPGGIHVSGGGPYLASLSSALQLEPVLVRHPKLRIWVMHYGSPLVEDMIALLYSHPQVYVDIAQNNWGFPRPHFYRQLRQLVDAGFAKRILFGSDQMIWPETIRIAIETVEQADFLTDGQKRDIFYWNAARFFRFSEAEIARHHGGPPPAP